jgi:bla regulator protein blaR1
MIGFAVVALPEPSWLDIGAFLANHLWQSTLFAGCVGLLTVALKKNHAQVRHALWLSASVKFLVPFSLLMGLGSHLMRARPPEIVTQEFSFAVQQISQPFGSTEQPAAPATALNASPLVVRSLGTLLSVVWLAGCAAVLFLWWLRWRRVIRAVNEISVATEEREARALRCLEQKIGSRRRVEVVISKSALEPGIVGIFRPILLLPTGLSDRLIDLQLEAIITHELCHVRRWDNLTAAIHMLVESVFWFHPLVWWIGARMVDERERACDEEVLMYGNEPQAYAEGIIRVCQLCLESQLVCVSGVTGSNLEKRIEAIMIHRAARKLTLGKKLLLAGLGAATIAAPLTIGLLNPASSRAQSQPAVSGGSAVDTVSIKPTAAPVNFAKVQTTANANASSQFSATGITVALLLSTAYDVNSFQISGGPAWMNSKRFDVNVTGASQDSVKADLQNALSDQFKVRFHRETNQVAGYDLVIASGGAKLTEVPSGSVAQEKSRMFLSPPGHLTAMQSTMEQLARALSGQLRCPVLDKTGLTGVYDFTLDWILTPLPSAGNPLPAPSPETTASLLKAVPDQLGLELSPQTTPVEMLVIDYAEQPAGN